MNTSKTILVLCALVGAGAWFAIDLLGGGDAVRPADPVAVSSDALQLREAVAFRLERPMRHTWRAETPLFDRGVLAVIEGDPAQLAATQSPGPLLCWGAEIPQVLNDGRHHGRVVVVLPLLSERGLEDLAEAPLFLGPRVLAESMTLADVTRAAEQARRAGASAATPAALPLAAGEIALADENALYRRAAELLARHSPTETDRIAWLRGDVR